MASTSVITNFSEAGHLLRQRRYGVIIARNGKLAAVKFKRWPKLIAVPEISGMESLRRRFLHSDECRVFYNQPRGHSGFLALKYLKSGPSTSMKTVHVALAALDEIARIKRTDALLCDAASFRLSPRLLSRYGWEAHKPQRWHRNYIKRFYGEYPPLDERFRTAIYGAASHEVDEVKGDDADVASAASLLRFGFALAQRQSTAGQASSGTQRG